MSMYLKSAVVGSLDFTELRKAVEGNYNRGRIGNDVDTFRVVEGAGGIYQLFFNKPARTSRMVRAPMNLDSKSDTLMYKVM